MWGYVGQSLAHVLDCRVTRMTPLSSDLLRKRNVRPWSRADTSRDSSFSQHVPAFESRHSGTCAGLTWDPARWSQRWPQLGYEWAKLLWSRCLWRAPFSRRGEPKLNKYLLHPVCIKGLHTWLWRQSDIKQGGVAQPALTGTCIRARSSVACY